MLIVALQLYKRDLDYLINEDHVTYNMPILDENDVSSFAAAYRFLHNTVLSKKFLEKNCIYGVINAYHENFYENSTLINIDELIELYGTCKEFLMEHSSNNSNNIDDDSTLYTEENFMRNGFIKSDYVIHQHDSRHAPLHWDFRFKTEFKTSAYSFVILKHKMPDSNEKLLCKRQPMHPPVWVDLDHTEIASGYGAGSVITIDRGTIYYKEKNDSFTFYIKGNKNKGAFHLIKINYSNYLFFEAQNSILSTKEERNSEWLSYAKTFVEYLNTRAQKTFKNKLPSTYSANIDDGAIDDYDKHILHSRSMNNKLIAIPSLDYCINLKNSNTFKDDISKECNIRTYEDVMRLYMSREYTYKIVNFELDNSMRQRLLKEVLDNVPYHDHNLRKIESLNPNKYPYEKLYRVFADIYLGHKFYGAYDFEKNLLRILSTKEEL